jgi:uncharacterized protein
MMLSPKCAVRGNPFLSLRSARIAMATLYLATAPLLCFPGLGVAFNFPALTGRVVDQAGIMTTQSRSELEAKLKNLEDKSGIQVVIATLKSLEGSDIETYANQLFRNWRLGEAKKNNGVLLLVAPNEHKVRIEVGYGLEGTLTDALSSVIISSAMVPRFKTNDFSGGIERGVDGIISVLSGDTTDWQPKPSVRAEDPPPLPNELFTILFILIAIFVIWSLIRSARGTPSGRYVRRGGPVIFFPTGGSWGSSRWGGGFGPQRPDADPAIQLHMEPALRRGGRHLLEYLLQARQRRRPRPLQAHRSRLVRDYVDSEGGDIQLEFLPPYAPELNPVEYLWAHWKQHQMPNFCPKDFAELSAFARAKLKRTQRRKLLVAAFWKQADLPF